MREAYTDQLDEVYHDLVEITRLVAQAADRAGRALLTADLDLAESVISDDQHVDHLREQVEEKSFSLLTLQQPVAGDLRMIVATLRAVSELERAGDLAAHVAKITRLRVPEHAVPEQVRPIVEQMAQTSSSMMNTLVQVLADRDVAAAHDLIERDEAMDKLRRQNFSTMLADDWNAGVEAAIDNALLGRYFERIADHAVSVSRRLIFVVTGEVDHDLRES